MSKDSPIGNRPIIDPIYCVYFYYVKYDKTKPTEIKLYYYSDDNDRIRDEIDLRQILKKLARNAKVLNVGDFAPPPCGYNFSTVPWRRRSYLAILAEGNDHEFSKASDVDLDYEGKDKKYNHSFFNADLMEIDLSDDNSGYNVSVFYCVNLMRHVSGRDIRDGESEKYSVTLFPGTKKMKCYGRDDGGTNQGGPIPPLVKKQARARKPA